MTKKVSRQRLHQLRQRAKGLCEKCSRKTWRKGANLCPYHHQKDLERRRKSP